MTELGCEDDTGIMRDGVILSGERGRDTAAFGEIDLNFGRLRGLGVRSVSAETAGSSGGFRRATIFRCGSSGDMRECPFNVLFHAGAARV